MEKVKYSIRKIYQEGGGSRRIGGRSNPSVPLKGAYVLVQLPGESKARVAIIEDLFSDSDAFFATMVKSSAYSISPGTAVYDDDGKLVSATVTWADGSTGQVQYNYLDDNGSYELNATKEAGGTLPVTYKDVTIKDDNGRTVSSISYARYATDDQGTGFTKTFNPAIHTHRGIYVSSEQLTDSQITADLFIGLWEPYAPLYTYTRYASDDQGTDFSSSYVVGTHTHRAVLTHTYLAPDDIVPALFAGKWLPWAPDDTYDGGTW